MSKYILRKRTSGFTTVSNNVIHALNSNLEALGLYLYLLSLPDNWEFHKNHLQKTCHIGRDKLEKLLKILGSFELVQTGQKRNNKGQFEEFYIDIYDLESIKINKLENTGSPVTENHRTVKTRARFQPTIKEIRTKEITKNKKENKNTCSTEVERVSTFNDFWSLYPRRQKKVEAQKIWKKEKLDEKAQIIIDALKRRLNTEWINTPLKYIPLPATYLNNKQWEDEVFTHIEPLVRHHKTFSPGMEFASKVLEEAKDKFIKTTQNTQKRIL